MKENKYKNDDKEMNDIYPERTSHFHNSEEVDKNDYITNSMHKEIGKNIKRISRKYMYGSMGLLVILGIFAVVYCLIVTFEEEEFGWGFLAILLLLITINGLLINCYYIFLLSSGYGAIVEDVYVIRKSLEKVDDHSNFDDLPRL